MDDRTTSSDKHIATVPAAAAPNVAPVPQSLTPVDAPTNTNAPVKDPGVMLAPPSPDVLRRRQRNRAVWIAVLSVVAVVAVSTLCIYMFVTRDVGKATSVSNDFIAALQAEDTQRAYDDGGSEFKNSTSQTQLAAVSSQLKQYIGSAHLDVLKTYVGKTDAGTHAAIVYRAQNDGQDYYVRVVLDKTNQDAWQVRNFRISKSPLEAKVE